MHIKITGQDSGQHDTFKPTLNVCLASKIILKIIANTNKLCNLSIMLNFRILTLFVHK